MSSRTTLAFEAAGKSGVLHIDASGGSPAVHGSRAPSMVVTRAGMSFLYTTLFDGAELPEENSVLSNSVLDETLNRLKIVIEKGEVGFDEAGVQVAWFAIHTVRESDQRATIVHRRFRDFMSANEELRAAYKGSHLLSSFPAMPGRSWKLFEVKGEGERWQLEAARLASHPVAPAAHFPNRQPPPHSSPPTPPAPPPPLTGPLLAGLHLAAAVAAAGLPREALADPAHALQPRLPDLPR